MPMLHISLISCIVLGHAGVDARSAPAAHVEVTVQEVEWVGPPAMLPRGVRVISSCTVALANGKPASISVGDGMGGVWTVDATGILKQKGVLLEIEARHERRGLHPETVQAFSTLDAATGVTYRLGGWERHGAAYRFLSVVVSPVRKPR